MVDQLVLSSFEHAVDESYDGSRDHVDPDLDPYEQSTFVSRALYAVAPVRSLASVVTTNPIVVPFYPGVGQGDVSDKVYAVKRAYARSVSGFRLRALMNKPLEVRRTWGPQFSDEFGWEQYTQTRHQTLAKYFDSFALELWNRKPAMSPRDLKINRQISWHTALYNRRFQVPYSQLRPSQLYRPSLITRADCSGSVAGGCDWADILPAVDWRWTNTRTQVYFGARVAGISSAKRGDVIFYGSDGNNLPTHVALYLGDGIVWSFGSYPIKILRHDYRHDRHSIRRFVPL